MPATSFNQFRLEATKTGKDIKCSKKNKKQLFGLDRQTSSLVGDSIMIGSERSILQRVRNTFCKLFICKCLHSLGIYVLNFFGIMILRHERVKIQKFYKCSVFTGEYYCICQKKGV